jgi:hypothetical protein
VVYKQAKKEKVIGFRKRLLKEISKSLIVAKALSLGR